MLEETSSQLHEHAESSKCQRIDLGALTTTSTFRVHTIIRPTRFSTPLVVRASEVPLNELDRCCPVCLSSPDNAKEMDSHLALHLEQFALFSLARSVDEDDSDGEKGSNDANVPINDLRDGDPEGLSLFLDNAPGSIEIEETRPHRASAGDEIAGHACGVDSIHA